MREAKFLGFPGVFLGDGYDSNHRPESLKGVSPRASCAAWIARQPSGSGPGPATRPEVLQDFCQGEALVVGEWWR
jgi:hypothetical protein